MKRSIYVQVWGEQKHPKPIEAFKTLSTKEYFEAEKKLTTAGKNLRRKVSVQHHTVQFKNALKTDVDVIIETFELYHSLTVD